MQDDRGHHRNWPEGRPTLHFDNLFLQPLLSVILLCSQTVWKQLERRQYAVFCTELS